MMLTQGATFRLMTYNVGGGRKDSLSSVDFVLRVIRKEAPDILALQEAAEWQDMEERWHSIVPEITEVLKNLRNSYFGPTLSMHEHFHTGKLIFVNGIFNDWLNWKQGNAILSDWPFVRLGDPSRPGKPRNIPLFRPAKYEGNRDTDPRYALLARVAGEKISPFVISTHLSTLRGERGGPEHEIPGKAEQAQAMRSEQISSLLQLLKDHPLKNGELVFLMGDFNATADEKCIKDLVDKGFVHLAPENHGHGAPTHPKVKESIDHIFVYPASRLIEYKCQIINTEDSQKASDHLPVVADVTVV